MLAIRSWSMEFIESECYEMNHMFQTAILPEILSKLGFLS